MDKESTNGKPGLTSPTSPDRLVAEIQNAKKGRYRSFKEFLNFAKKGTNIFKLKTRTTAVEYIANTGQYFRAPSGRVFCLNVHNKRVSLFEAGSKNKYILVESIGCDPGAELVHKIGEIAVGEQLRAIPRAHYEEHLREQNDDFVFI